MRPFSPTRRLLSAANAVAIALRAVAAEAIETEDGVALESEGGVELETEG